MSHLGKVIIEEEFKRFKSGDQKAFKKIFDVYYQLIYKYILSYSKNEEEAEELVQEAFVLLFINRLKIEDATGIYPYLFVVAKRLTISQFKRKVVQSKFTDHLRYNWTEECTSTEENLNASELSNLLQNIIEELPPRQQEVYCLNKFDDLSYQEIADKMGVSKNTVKNQLIAASKTVKWKIAKMYTFLFIIKIFF